MTIDANTLIRLDKIHDQIPVVCTVSNLIKLGVKHIYIPIMRHYYGENACQSFWEKRICRQELINPMLFGVPHFIQRVLNHYPEEDQKKLQEWAGDQENKKEAAKRIEEFIADPTDVSVPSPKVLHLDHLELDSLPDIFSNIEMRYRLEELHLENNQLKSLPPSIASVKKIVGIFLQENQFEEVPSVLSEIEDYFCVDMTGNPINPGSNFEKPKNMILYTDKK